MTFGLHCKGQWWSRLVTHIGCGLALALLISASLSAAEPTDLQASTQQPAIALIIDDLGNQWQLGEQVVNLPGSVACAFLPYGAYTKRLALSAFADNKEVMLHLPMHTMDHRPLDRGALTLDMTETEFNNTVLQNIAAVPHVSGINNHMGSLLTRHPGHMHWLMDVMKNKGSLFFVDSRTTDRSVARQVAMETGVPSVQRDVFLDVQRDEAAILAQFLKLVDKAHRKGTAVGIGHPYPETLAVLEKELRRLSSYDIRLVSIRQLIELKHERQKTWRASLSH